MEPPAGPEPSRESSGHPPRSHGVHGLVPQHRETRRVAGVEPPRTRGFGPAVGAPTRPRSADHGPRRRSTTALPSGSGSGGVRRFTATLELGRRSDGFSGSRALGQPQHDLGSACVRFRVCADDSTRRGAVDGVAGRSDAERQLASAEGSVSGRIDDGGTPGRCLLRRAARASASEQLLHGRVEGEGGR